MAVFRNVKRSQFACEPTVVSFFWGDPSAYIATVYTAGSLVMQTVGSATEARRVRAAGVDIVVAQGWGYSPSRWWINRTSLLPT
jgi:NAD(P)H-dependent flavin oxidoreductase YrpB (nitropropane dioxygenase family)